MHISLHFKLISLTLHSETPASIVIRVVQSRIMQYSRIILE